MFYKFNFYLVYSDNSTKQFGATFPHNMLSCFINSKYIEKTSYTQIGKHVGLFFVYLA